MLFNWNTQHVFAAGDTIKQMRCGKTKMEQVNVFSFMCHTFKQRYYSIHALQLAFATYVSKHCLYVCLNLVLALFLYSKQNVKKKHFKCTTTIDGWCHIYSNCSGVFIPIKTHYGNDFILATRKPKTYIDTGEREMEIERELSISRSRSLTSDLRFLFSTIYFAIETITSHHLRAAKKELVRFFLLLFRIKALLYSSYCSHCGYVWWKLQFSYSHLKHFSLEMCSILSWLSNIMITIDIISEAKYIIYILLKFLRFKPISSVVKTIFIYFVPFEILQILATI